MDWIVNGRRMFGAIAGAVGLMVGATALGDQPLADKSGFHLFNPTPRELMRELSPDRPDGTESPKTVDAGHFAVELSFFDFVRDKGNGQTTEVWTAFDTNLKVGLLNNVDLQFVFSAYTEEQTEPDGARREILNGFADPQLRLKVNLWGNDEGKTAFGVLPFIKIPTGSELSNDHVEGGWAFLYGVELGETWGLGLMAEIDAVYDEDDKSYDTEFIHTAVVGFDISGPLGGFVEYIGIASTDANTNYKAIFSTGLTYSLSEDVMLDVGTQIGLNDAADDVNVFMGMTIRF